MDAKLNTLKSGFKTWLFDHALPLWAQKGVDQAKGGFYERLNLDGTPDDINRRTRVAARQVYSYALAKRMGYKGVSDAVIDQGLAWLSGPAKSPEGMVYAVLSPTGEVVRAEFDFYDHAFTLLAYASAYKVRPHDSNLKARGKFIRDYIVSHYRHPDRGFEESIPRSLPLKANPHMHMFEACLAWIDAGGDKVWHDLASEIAELCLDKFLHPVTGALREFFDGEWNVIKGEAGRIVEPGHQFEWAWLMIRWYQLEGDERFLTAAKRLIEIGEAHGTDQVRGVSVNEVWDDFKPKDSKARLWPQTERMKAYSALHSVATHPSDAAMAIEKAIEACDGLKLYFKTEIEGLYSDKMNEDGSLVVESAPTSSLYHIICAIDEINKIEV